MLAIFVVETNSRNRSDEIYIRKYLKSFYDINSGDDVIRTVYLGGKDNYRDSARQEDIRTLTSKYLSIERDDRKVVVMYLIDTDDISRGPDANTNRRKAKEIEEFCRQRNYEFIWFHEVIEEAFVGTRVSSNEKKAAAEQFERKVRININRSKLRYSDFSECKIGTSNIDLVFRQFFTEKAC